jgi:hypothetical protein
VREGCSAGADVCFAAMRVLESTTRSGTPRSRRAASLKTRLLCSFLLRHSHSARANGERRDAVAGRPVGKGNGGGAQQLDRETESGWPSLATGRCQS